MTSQRKYRLHKHFRRIQLCPWLFGYFVAQEALLNYAVLNLEPFSIRLYAVENQKNILSIRPILLNNFLKRVFIFTVS